MTHRRRLSPIVLLLLGCGSATAAEGGETPNEALASRTATQQSSDAVADGRGRAPTAAERETIGELSRTAERIRALSFEHKVPVRIQDDVRITARLTAQIEPEDLEEAQVVYGALGLIDPETDLRGLLERLVAEQVVGYYDPDDGRLVVREDVMDALRGETELQQKPLDEARIVLVHELVHALQDQHLGLGRRYDEDRDTDADNAFQGLVEGDATLAMMGYVADRSGSNLEMMTRSPELLGQLMGDTRALPGAELGSAPPIVRVTMVGAYLHGMVFAATLYKRDGWRGVDRAHRNVPISTEQIMHPEAYLRGEGTDDVRIPELTELQEAGFEPFDEDTLGELEMGVYLAQGTAGDVDHEAAAGWAGDRLRVYRGDERDAVVWFTSWDDADEAQQAAAAARRVRQSVPAPQRQRHRVEWIGRGVLIVRGLPPRLHASVLRTFRKFAEALPAEAPVARAP